MKTKKAESYPNFHVIVYAARRYISLLANERRIYEMYASDLKAAKTLFERPIFGRALLTPRQQDTLELVQKLKGQLQESAGLLRTLSRPLDIPALADDEPDNDTELEAVYEANQSVSSFYEKTEANIKEAVGRLFLKLKEEIELYGTFVVRAVSAQLKLHAELLPVIYWQQNGSISISQKVRLVDTDGSTVEVRHRPPPSSQFANDPAAALPRIDKTIDAIREICALIATMVNACYDDMNAGHELNLAESAIDWSDRLGLPQRQQQVAGTDVAVVKNVAKPDINRHPYKGKKKRAFDVLRQTKQPLLGKEVADRAKCSEGTFFTHYVPDFKKDGLIQAEGGGYFFPPGTDFSHM